MNQDIQLGGDPRIGQTQDIMMADELEKYRGSKLYAYQKAYRKQDIAALLSYMNEMQQMTWTQWYIKIKPTTPRKRVFFSYGNKPDGPPGGVDFGSHALQRALLRGAYVILTSPAFFHLRAHELPIAP